MSLLAVFGFPGPIEMLIVALVILLLFGNRVPSVMRNLGRGIVEFKRGLSGSTDEENSPAPPSSSNSTSDSSKP